MKISDKQITFDDTLCSEIETTRIKGYQLDDSTLILHVAHDSGHVSITSLNFLNQQLAYENYLTLVNLNIRPI